jgi:hypothetical protein
MDDFTHDSKRTMVLDWRERKNSRMKRPHVINSPDNRRRFPSIRAVSTSSILLPPRPVAALQCCTSMLANRISSIDF